MKSRYAIREITTPAGTVRFEVSGYTEKGKQHRKRFKTEDEAHGEIHRLEMADRRVVNNTQTVSTRLTHEQVREAEKCFDRLPAGTSLTDAVDRLVEGWNKGERPEPMRDALVGHLEAMEKRGCSTSTLRGTRSKVKRFIDENDFAEVPIDQVVKDDVESWLNTLTIKSFNGYRLALSGLWSYAVERKWCKTNIVSGITAKTDKEIRKKRKIEALSVEQVRAMLRAASADGKSLAWTAVAIFAGLRPESELQHFTWNDVDMRADNIHVNENGKTGERHVKMHPTLKAWLQIATGQKFNLSRADLKHVKRAAGYRSGLVRTEGRDDHNADKGLAKYPTDITRHTFGSFLYGRELSYNLVADQMGNSVAIVKKHYKKSLPEDQVERFWNLTPGEVLGEKQLEAVG